MLRVSPDLRRHVGGFFSKRPQPLGLARQTRVEIGGRACSHGRLAEAVVVQGVEGIPAELGQARRVARRGAFSRKRLIFARKRIGLAKLLQLPAQVFLFTLPAGTQLFQVA